jgi:galactokinase/mevalonate kinase-like predicted kinase
VLFFLGIRGGLEGGPHKQVLDATNIDKFDDYTQSDDVFRMLKVALKVTAIVDEDSTAKQVLDDISKFTNGKGLHLRVTSHGPSRSGFASSSSVGINLLHALFQASGQEDILRNKRILGIMTLLMEKKLGLNSGQQDIDGPMYPGLKKIDYGPSTGTIAPKEEDVRQIQLTSKQEDSLFNNLILVNTGIARTHATDTR